MKLIILVIVLLSLCLTLRKKESIRQQRIRDQVQKREDIAYISRYSAMKEIERKAKCKSPERYFQADCECPDGFFDDGVHDECQRCPYPCLSCQNDSTFCHVCNLLKPYVSLQHLIPQEKLIALENYIFNDIKLFNDQERKIKGARTFIPNEPNHGKSVNLNTFPRLLDKWEFYEARKFKGSNYYFPKNPKYNFTFINQLIEDLDIFEYYGYTELIFNQPGDPGAPHRDHYFTDFMSEFLWLSPNNAKQFYIVDEQDQKSKYYVTSNLAYFEDQTFHGISPSNRQSLTLRIDGKFKPWVRQYILDHLPFRTEYQRELFKQQQTKLQPCENSVKCPYTGGALKAVELLYSKGCEEAIKSQKLLENIYETSYNQSEKFEDYKFQFIDYLDINQKNKLSRQKIYDVMENMNYTNPRDIMQRDSDLYHQLNMNQPSLTREDIIKSIIENPNLLQQPIVLYNGKAVVAQPPENIFSLFS